MTNLLTVLPDFDIAPYSHLLPSLEKARISVADLITLDPGHVAKRAQVPPGEVKKLVDAVIPALHASAIVEQPLADRPQHGSNEGFEKGAPPLRGSSISTLDDDLDAVLGGGIATGLLTEIVGESAAGKTQLLLTLLLSVQLPRDARFRSQKSALYISTEARLQTERLTQILKSHPKLANLPRADRPSLARIQSTQSHDLESQEHILRYQVPVAIQKHGIGLVVIDSIAANYRAEFDRGPKSGKNAESLAERNVQIAQLGALLRDLARTHKVAVVVANQVADRFGPPEPSSRPGSQSTQSTTLGPKSPPSTLGATALHRHPNASINSPLSTDDALALDHQQRFFTGWGDDGSVTGLKTPSLGLVWTNQLACRIALLKEPVFTKDGGDVGSWKRSFKVVFSAWCGPSTTDFEIWQGGVRSLLSTTVASEDS